MNRLTRASRWLGSAVLGTIAVLACGDAGEPDANACVADGRALEYGFFADFPPVSSSADLDPASAGFNEHLGYEADLLTALEAMRHTGIVLNRSGIDVWPDIWLRPAGPGYDFVGGGITILDSRTRNAQGETVVAFTSGHIAFRQSLLVRAEDADRFQSYGDLDDAGVAVLGGTTGEHRLLELAGVVDGDGNLAPGTVVHLGDGSALTADGSADYRITAGGSSANLNDRVRLEGPSGTVREVVYFLTDQGQLDALISGRVDAVARGAIGNGEASVNSGGALVVGLLDSEMELGGFAFSADEPALANCVDARLNWLTDTRKIGIAEWLADSQVFQRRAEMWNANEGAAAARGPSRLTGPSR